MKFTLLSIFIILSTLAAEIPSMINYQGILTNENGTVIDDNTYNLSFSIYDVASGGSELWSETHSGVEVTQGLFNIMLGSIISLADIPFDMQYYLEIAVGGDVMTDRIAFSSTAYSLNSRSVNGNQGIPAGGIIMWSGAIADIPTGWALCDGTNGTPDLMDKFIMGGDDITGGGGSWSHTHGDSIYVDSHALTSDELARHVHFIPATINSHSNYYPGSVDQENPDQAWYLPGAHGIGRATANESYQHLGSYNNGNEVDGDPHSHELSGNVIQADHIPPYIILGFIIKL